MTKKSTDAFPRKLFTVGDRYLLEWILPEPGNGVTEPQFIKVLREKKQISHIGGHSFIPLSSLGEALAAPGVLNPKLFIYHATRCGSTLLGQMLRSKAENRVFNEPRAVTELLMDIRSINDQNSQKMNLRNMIGAFGLGAPPWQKNLVFKFASLCNFYFDDIHEAFPNTPSVFIYRDPVEIMVGLVTGPAQWLYDIHFDKLRNVLPWSKNEAAALDFEHLSCLYLERQFQWALDRADAFDRLVNYTELPEAAFEIANIILESDIREACEEILPWNSKRPGKPFVPDSQKKQGMASAQIRELAETRLYPLYRELEAIRVEKLTSSK
jgi:hypothetical protein